MKVIDYYKPKKDIDNYKGLWIMYGEMIRSDQLEAKDLYQLKIDNPVFWKWYENEFSSK